MLSKSIAAISFAFLCSGAVHAACPPVTITTPAGEEARIGLARFQGEVLIAGAASLLERHGYCPVATGPEVEQGVSTCDQSTCTSAYDIVQRFESADGKPPRETRAHLDITSGPNGPVDQGVFKTSDLGISGIGSSPHLSVYDSEVFMSALWLAHVPVTIDMDRASVISAGRLVCYYAHGTGGARACEITSLDKTYELVDPEGVPVVHNTLKALGGTIDDGSTSGIEQSAAAEVSCKRPFPPNSDAICSLIIE